MFLLSEANVNCDNSIRYIVLIMSIWKLFSVFSPWLYCVTIGHQLMKEKHSNPTVHSSISVTRVNREPSRSAKSVSIGDYRRIKMISFSKATMIFMLPKIPSSSSRQKRRKSEFRKNSIDTSNNITKTNVQSEYNDKNNIDNQNRIS